jgi:addiction module HigA family antidote
MARLLSPIPPGEILREDFMRPLGLNANQLARHLGVPANRITGILSGRRAITAETALRLERYFDVSAQTWLNLQSDYELRLARRRVGEKVARAVALCARTAADERSHRLPDREAFIASVPRAMDSSRVPGEDRS